MEKELERILSSYPRLPSEREPQTQAPHHLLESIRYSVLDGGKRIRPRLVLAAAEALNLTRERALPAALALELIHCFTLIHDDLPCMDDDDFRRGKPSNHKQFDEATALLAGDALIPLAYEVLMESEKQGTPASALLQAMKTLSWACGARGVIGGQAAETSVVQNPSLPGLEAMHFQKTGALFVAAVTLPCDLAGISSTDAVYRALRDYGAALGLAFQIADDLEDLHGLENPEFELEKFAHKDPKSILFYLSPDQAREKARETLASASVELQTRLGNPAPLLSFAAEIQNKLN